MRLHPPVDLTGNVNMIEKLFLGGTGTGDLPILTSTVCLCVGIFCMYMPMSNSLYTCDEVLEWICKQLSMW